MEYILKVASLEPVELTYIGIGSCPHVAKNQELLPKYDQLLPQCFHEAILLQKKHMRIVHFDPYFEQEKEFIDSYFEKWGVIAIEIEGGYSYVSEGLEVLIYPMNIDHKEHEWFFESLSEIIIETNGKLVVQEYTGTSLDGLNYKLMEKSEKKDLYKKRILFDMTFGTDSGCCTDMTKAQPFYDYDLNFLNFHFANDTDAKQWAGISLKIDALLIKKYKTKFFLALNYIHVDYRRKLRGDTLMHGSSSYTEESTPDEIMSVLQTKLRAAFEVLRALRVVDIEEEMIFEEACKNYKEMDPYKWYDCMNKLFT